MLALSRREGETVVITVGDTVVKVHVGNVNAPRVTLIFDAPQSVTIDRLEVAQRKEQDRDA